MDTFIERVANEYRDLDKKIERLSSFLQRDGIQDTVGEKQYDLLDKQLSAMKQYRMILECRLEDFGLSIEEVAKHREPALSRNVIFTKACDDCLIEMYEKAQPSDSYIALCTEYELGKISKDERVYNRYYLSREEYTYIKEKYKEAYNIKEKWTEDINILLRDLNEGGLKDAYREDENGLGHRVAEKIPPLTELIGKEHADIVKQVIEDIRNFYRFDREENGFEWFIALGSASPTSNKDAVVKYWKERGVDVQIEDRNPDTFWEIDEYGGVLEEDDDDDIRESENNENAIEEDKR